MLKVFSIVFLVFSNCILAQKTIVNDTVFNYNLISFKVDSNIQKFTISSSCDSFSIQNITTNKTWKFKNNQFFLSQTQINNGQCFCASCIQFNTHIPNSKNSVFTIQSWGCKNDFKLQKVEQNSKKNYQKGDKLLLNNILFVAGKSILISSSYKELNALVELLIQQPEINILVRGHVNGQKKNNIEEYQELSEKRAKTIVDYLTAKGIKTERMKFEGRGNSEMIYPKPKSEEEMILNRRVEIIIW